MLSQGVPMLLAGDEIGRTQRGNNNAYCQDNEISWVDWELGDEQRRLQAFTKRLIEIRRRHPVFRRADFLRGVESNGSGAPDVWWFRPDGRVMRRGDWERGDAFALAVFLNGAEIGTETWDGEPVVDDSFVVLFNAWQDEISFRLPPARFGRRWELELSTSEPELEPGARSFPVRGDVAVEGRSLLLLRRVA